MSESSIHSNISYSKVPFIDPAVNVVHENRLLAGSKGFARLAQPQATRFLVVLITYALCLTGSLWFSYQLRFNFLVPADQVLQFNTLAGWIIPLKLIVLLLAVQFDGLLSYFSIPDLRRLAASLATASLILAGIWWVSEGKLSPPRGVLAMDFLLSLLSLSSVRLLFRLIRERYTAPASPWNGQMERVGIIGAGDVGASLARELCVKRSLGIKPVVFLDDDTSKWRCRIHNIPVIGPPEYLLEEKNQLKLDKVILAMPSAANKRIQEIKDMLRKAQIPCVTVPALDQLATGKVKVTQLQQFRPDDLFQQNQLHLDLEKINELFANKVVMVTGAGGHIGGALAKQIASVRPRQIILLDQCEVYLFQIEQEMIQLGYKEIIVPVIADILDKARLEVVFNRFRPEIVLHAAAHKNSPFFENQPDELIQTNVFGTAHVAELASACGSSHFMMISSDQAHEPQSVIGATKRLAERVIENLAADPGNRTCFQIVRFDDSVGTSEKIIRLVTKQIASGGPVKISHPGAVCHSMTVAEASGLILQSMVLGSNGSILVLDAGDPIKLLDMVHKMIELCGLKPDQDIEIEFTGLRKGECMSQSNHVTRTSLGCTSHANILTLAKAPQVENSFIESLSELRVHLHQSSTATLKQLLQKIVPEYASFPELIEEPPKNKTAPFAIREPALT